MSDDLSFLDLGSIPDENIPKPPSGWKYLARGGALRCAFSTTKSMKMGMGASANTHASQTFWFVTQISSDAFEGRLINNRHVPADEVHPIPLDQLVNDYTAEISYFEELVLPAMKEHGMDSELSKPLEEECATSLFGLALIYASRREVDRAAGVINDLVRLKSGFTGRGQFLFNDFGIALRKNGLSAEALECFQRAAQFVTNDENLYYNLARAYYENDDWNGCIDNLVQSHRINPQLEVVHNLLEVIVGLEDNHIRLAQFGKSPVPPDVATRARQILAADSGKLKLDEGPVMSVEPGRARSGSAGIGVVELRRHGSDDD